MKSVCIIDYGMGNIKSLSNAIKKIGYKTYFFSKDSEIKTKLAIIPGVGAFNSAMKMIKKKKIDKKIKEFLKKKNNFLLGICLGKQLLYSTSQENGFNKGLNLIKGNVNILSNKKKTILPNVGWKKIFIKKNISSNFSFLTKFNGKSFYFIHSYTGIPHYKNNILSISRFENKKFCSIVSNNKNIIGTQFHPEKSSVIGLKFLDTVIKKLA